MPHAQRKLSETGFYHVVVKGDGGQIIFEGDKDRSRFIEELESSTVEHAIEIHAYCLMDNHVHLLLRDREGNLSHFMKQLCENYARYFARKTGRVGHVFQGRYWSEPVDCDEFFLAAMRYIHANPEPAGICKANDYPWSSYRAYLEAPKGDSFITTDLALSLLGDAKSFKAFHEQLAPSAKPFAKSSLTRHLSLDELVSIAIALLGRETLSNLKTLQSTQRAIELQKLKAAGMTPTEIARITGIGVQSITRSLSPKTGIG